MEKYDIVKLINDTEELFSKNIFKGICGVLVSYISSADEWVVMFLDDNNYGIFAVAKTKTKDLEYSSRLPEAWIEEFNKRIASPDFYAHTELKPPKFKEYDKVMLINAKPRYTKEGLKKGDTGCVMSAYAIKNEWHVIFSEEGTGEDIADICVHEDDMEKID